MSIFPDWTLFFQAGIFIFLIIFLSKVLFKPVVQVLEAREQMHLGPKAEAERLKAEAEQLKEVIGQAIEQAKAEADKHRNDAVTQARKLEEEILQAGRNESESLLKEARGSIAEEVRAASAALQSEAQNIGAIIAEKLVAPSRQGGRS